MIKKIRTLTVQINLFKIDKGKIIVIRRETWLLTSCHVCVSVCDGSHMGGMVNKEVRLAIGCEGFGCDCKSSVSQLRGWWRHNWVVEEG
ncbi:hypothetical protein OC709_01940 ['Planchonia careya' phytoplasma]|nr:hypothetical protein ['Planchonia careya' phytoplasma]MDO8030263.1 hypothetical protein ['Planchonia careya' phytoplasma]